MEVKYRFSSKLLTVWGVKKRQALVYLNFFSLSHENLIHNRYVGIIPVFRQKNIVKNQLEDKAARPN